MSRYLVDRVSGLANVQVLTRTQIIALEGAEGVVAQADGLNSLPAFAPERLSTTTHFFVDLVFMPMIMRALFGEKLKSRGAEVGTHVARSVAFFLAACQHGGVN